MKIRDAMRPVSSVFTAVGGLLLVLTTGALAQGLTNAIPGPGKNQPASPAPAPVKPAQPAAPAPAAAPPSPTVPVPAAPASPASANPQLEQRLAQLRVQLAERKSDTAETIQPLASLDEVRQRLRQYRARVDRVQRSPFVSGAPLPEDLVRAAKATQAEWGGLDDAIRAGQPPATLPAATLRRLSQPVTAADPAPVTGNVWSGLSNDYFAEIARGEKLAEVRATPFREAPTMREFDRLMGKAEARLREIEAGAGNPESEDNLRDLSWRLHRIWQLGAELQVHQMEQQLKAGPGEQALLQFLQASDAARTLRHRGISAATEGNSLPAVFVPVKAGATIRAQLGDAESTVAVNPVVPSRLAVLAAELYHAHYLLANVEEFERETDQAELDSIQSARIPSEQAERTRAHAASHEERITSRRREYEGRRLQVSREIVAETERLRSIGG